MSRRRKCRHVANGVFHAEGHRLHRGSTETYENHGILARACSPTKSLPGEGARRGSAWFPSSWMIRRPRTRMIFAETIKFPARSVAGTSECDTYQEDFHGSDADRPGEAGRQQHASVGRHAGSVERGFQPLSASLPWPRSPRAPPRTPFSRWSSPSRLSPSRFFGPTAGESPCGRSRREFFVLDDMAEASHSIKLPEIEKKPAVPRRRAARGSQADCGPHVLALRQLVRLAPAVRFKAGTTSARTRGRSRRARTCCRKPRRRPLPPSASHSFPRESHVPPVEQVTRCQPWVPGTVAAAVTAAGSYGSRPGPSADEGARGAGARGHPGVRLDALVHSRPIGERFGARLSTNSRPA